MSRYCGITVIRSSDSKVEVPLPNSAPGAVVARAATNIMSIPAPTGYMKVPVTTVVVPAPNVYRNRLWAVLQVLKSSSMETGLVDERLRTGMLNDTWT